MASKPMQRSLKYLKECGWTVCVVERWKPVFDKRTGQMRQFGVRVDAFGFGDILACIGPYNHETALCLPGIALVQTTDYTSFSKHKIKILALPEFQAWKAAGGQVWLHAWGKRPKDGVRGARKVWVLRSELL